MATNTLKTRIQHKNGSASDWSQATTFVPLKGELVIYNDATAPKIKVGDGTTLVENLPFVGVSITMNGETASNPSFYAPTSAGTAGQVLQSNGSGAPSWITLGSNAYTNTAYVAQSANGTQCIVNTAEGADTALALKGNSSDSWLGFLNKDNISLGWIGFADQGDLRVDTTSGVYNILHSGNYSSYALPLTGGTMTGTITIPATSGTRLLWGQTTDKNTTYNIPWYSLSFYDDGVQQGNVLGLANYWGINFITGGDSSVNLYHNGNQILNASNYTNYAPTKTGSGASGTWGISITGNAATATTLSSTLAINKGGTGATTKHEAFHNLVFQGAVTNADACMKRGLYTYATAATNTPESATYGGIETIICNDIAEGTAIGGSTSSSWVWQWGYCTNRVNPYIRYSINANAFSAWKKVVLEGDGITAQNGNVVVGSTESTTYRHVQVARLGSDNTNKCTISMYVSANGQSGALVTNLNGTSVGTATFGTNFSHTGTITGTKVYGAVWNDYAEYRSQNETIEPGYITYCDDDGKLKKTTERLQKFEGVVSDTYGFAIGETDDCKTPLAVSGRALVYCDPEEEHFHSGDCVCAGPDGLAYRMTREEVIEFPDRVVGVVSEIPTYETWGSGNVKVDGRIWIKVK